MVQASCEMKASPYEAEEMEFLSTLCEKIRQDNSIILLYIQVMIQQNGLLCTPICFPWCSLHITKALNFNFSDHINNVSHSCIWHLQPHLILHSLLHYTGGGKQFHLFLFLVEFICVKIFWSNKG